MNLDAISGLIVDQVGRPHETGIRIGVTDRVSVRVRDSARVRD